LSADPVPALKAGTHQAPWPGPPAGRRRRTSPHAAEGSRRRACCVRGREGL